MTKLGEYLMRSLKCIEYVIIGNSFIGLELDLMIEKESTLKFPLIIAFFFSCLYTLKIFFMNIRH